MILAMKPDSLAPRLRLNHPARLEGNSKEVNMGLMSWTLLAATLIGPPASERPADSSAEGLARAGRSSQPGVRVPIRRVLYQPAKSTGRLIVRWIGQDEHDYVGPNNRANPSDVQDIHLELGNLDPAREVVFIDVTAQGNQWHYNKQSFAWKAELKRTKGSPTADLFFEPARAENGRPFHILVKYDDDRAVEADFRSRKASASLRMPGAAVAALWIGQDGQDWTGAGPSVGPDGIQDVRLELTGLSTKVPLKWLRIDAPGGAHWEFGTNPQLAASAELVRNVDDRSRGDLYLEPKSDLKGERLKLTLLYDDYYDNKIFDTTTVLAGRSNPKLPMPALPLPKLLERKMTAKWLGQDHQGPGGPGDVHVVISGVPGTSTIKGAVLSDSVQGAWIYRGSDRLRLPADPLAEPLLVSIRPDQKSLDLFFAPCRDEAKETMTLRLIAADGQSSLVRFPGGAWDPSLLAPGPDATSTEAKPGDDLQSLVDRFGTVVLSKGTYRLSHPLVLKRPISLQSDGGATLLFEQPAGDAPWTTAIKIHCGNTSLRGFAVRFAGPVRWNWQTSFGPAVIGLKDNFDDGHDEPKPNISITRLNLEAPPVEDPRGWVESVRLMRLLHARNGVVTENVLRGGPVEFFGGPWQLVDNEFRGTPVGTFCHCVFGGHGTHDVVVRGNRTRADGASGKTWRFLVLTGRSTGDLIERNTIEGVGARDDDTIPWSNEPEIILTEGYHARYEGKVMALSSDGRLMRTGRLQGEPARTGDAVSLLNGPAAGRWRQIVQEIEPDLFLVDPPIPTGTEIVSISPGFVNQIYRDNRIDVRGGTRSDALVLPGNHFRTRIVNNHLLGGAHAFRLTSFASETPMYWGWTHLPFLGVVVEGNIIEDCDQGGILGVEHDPSNIKSNQGRTYMTVTAKNNVVRWSAEFLSRHERAGAKQPLAGFTLGFPPSHDPGELVVVAAGNRLEAPSQHLHDPALLIHAAVYNSKQVVNRKLALGTGSPPPEPVRNGANVKGAGPRR
jgi:hypothetical protein